MWVEPLSRVERSAAPLSFRALRRSADVRQPVCFVLEAKNKRLRRKTLRSVDMAAAFDVALERHRQVPMVTPCQHDAVVLRTTKNPAEAGFLSACVIAIESSGFECLDARGQAALMTSGLVLVDQAAGAEAVENRLGDGEGGFGAGGVVGVERFEHFLDGGAQHGALSGVTGIAHDGLLGAFLGGLDVGHDGILRCCEFDRRSLKAEAFERVRIPLGDEKRREQTAAMRTVRPKIMGDSDVCVNWTHIPDRFWGRA